jgi:hypothetical protein
VSGNIYGVEFEIGILYHFLPVHLKFATGKDVFGMRFLCVSVFFFLGVGGGVLGGWREVDALRQSHFSYHHTHFTKMGTLVQDPCPITGVSPPPPPSFLFCGEKIKR